MYSILRKLLFCLPPEVAHAVALRGLQVAERLRLTRFLSKPLAAPRTVMGLNFPNPIGLAAGLDKNAEYVDALAALGFGFIEIGTVTPRPQPGNAKPRLFRLNKAEALINRFGFNSKGADYVADRLAHTHYRGILGINLGKNRDTPLENAVDDYLIGFRKLWLYASYITINISSPNTQGLRELQKDDALIALLTALKQEQQDLLSKHQRYIPLVVKISPDLSEAEVVSLAAILLAQKIDGVIATNTTIHRDGVDDLPCADEVGGLSGRPLQARSTSVAKQLHAALAGKIPIIACGGIMDAASAEEKWQAGAALLQVYTGLIYQGPGLVGDVV